MLSVTASRRTQLICAWCGPLFLLFFGLGMVPLAGLLPPPTAHDTAAQVVKLYTSHHARRQAGFTLMLVATGFIGPWVAVISAQLRRIGERVTALVYGQLVTGASLIFVVLAPVMAMIVASFRPERDPQITQALNDLAWIPFIMVFPPLAAQMVCIALAIFSDDAEQVFPRWVAYLNVWCAVLLVPAVLLPFFKTGPFAWEGIFQFWLAALIFFGWMAVMSVMLIKVVRAQPH
jgi:hypothetical protein